MDYVRSFAISAAGMSVERARVEVAALNLANANTLSGPGDVGYRPLRVIARTAASEAGTPALSFAEQVASGLSSAGASGVELPQVLVEPTSDEPRLVHDPGNPFADEMGFVAYPAVDTAAEMVNLMSALRAYEANVAAMNTSRSLALKALEIGGAT